MADQQQTVYPHKCSPVNCRLSAGQEKYAKSKTNVLPLCHATSTTSNNKKLIHWPLMGGLLHLVQRGADWAGPQPAQALPRCIKCNRQPTDQRPVYQSPYCCIMVRCSAVLMCPKGLDHQPATHRSAPQSSHFRARPSF